MIYLIKSLKWTRHYKKETWWGPDSSGYTDYICNAGIYTEEDKINKEATISPRDIVFVPVTQKIISKGIKQLTDNLKKSKEELTNIHKRYERDMDDEKKRIELINSKIRKLKKYEALGINYK